MQFTVGVGATPGVFPLLITASDGLATREAAFSLTVLQASAGSWRQLALGDTPALYYGVIVGDIGNTGQNRVIASGGQGLMYAYSFDGTSWSSSPMPFNDPADVEMHNMAIGAARNDGVNRLYIAAVGLGRVYEVSWSGGAWQKSVIATLTGATDMSIGDGRNDGVLRLYVTWMSGTTEITWTGSSWSQLTMSNNEGGWVHGLDLAPGRNDGVNRIYTANQGNGQVYEYSWNGVAWAKQFVGSSSDMRNIKVGEGRNDGLLRLYAASGDSNVYEYTWTGASWQGVSIGNASVGGVKVHSIPARAKPDDRVRIYAAASNGGVYEYNWTGSAWQTTSMGLATAYMYGLDAGDGLNAGTVQVYGSSYDGNAYSYEWVPDAPPLLVAVPNVVGLTEADARTAIAGATLTVGTVTNPGGGGLVTIQSPTAGTRVAPGTAVAFTVAAATVPGAPTSVSAVAGDAQATVSFAAPASDGGAAITSYTVTPFIGATAQPSTIGAGSPVTVTGLTNGTTYTFTVTATNSVGSGPASGPSNAVTPTAVAVPGPRPA